MRPRVTQIVLPYLSELFTHESQESQCEESLVVLLRVRVWRLLPSMQHLPPRAITNCYAWQ